MSNIGYSLQKNSYIYLYVTLHPCRIMNNNTVLLMFAVIAAFGLVTATLVVPILHQAYAAGRPCTTPDDCKAFGLSHSTKRR
jgi:hypothetical protein